MELKQISLSKLVVNKNNDRHGEMENETAAIEWLFSNKPQQMLNLANDIAEQGLLDPPLVKSDGTKFVVYDGNRRVTCLKLLANPELAPERFQANFVKISRKAQIPKDMNVGCQVETDQSRIDVTLSRRHNGTDEGRGQLSWDTRAKANHANRVGGTNQYPIAEAVERFLEDEGYPNAQSIGRSTLFRLLSAKKRQKQFGIALGDDGSLVLLKDKEDILPALAKVADDILDKKLTLKSLLNVKDISKYLKTLEGFGLAAEETAETKVTGRPKDSQTRQAGKAQRVRRETFIPKDRRFDIIWSERQGKIERVWDELRFSLKFTQHSLSIPIMARTLLELATDYASPRMDLSIGNALSKKMRLVAERLGADGYLSKKEVQDLHRFVHDSKSPRDIEALHRAVHSPSFSISKEDLIGVWDIIEPYVLACIRYEKPQA